MKTRWVLWFGAAAAGIAAALGCGARSGLDGASAHDGGAGMPYGGRGGGGAAGFAGSGGTVAAGRSGASGMAGAETCGPLIDDLESGTGRICHGEGRVGVWYAFNDKAGTQWPALTVPGTPILPTSIPGGRSASTLAMHTFGEGFGIWGAGVGLDLSFDGVTYGLYDARTRGYDGVTFWARGSPIPRVFFRISTSVTTLTTYGGVCQREPCNPYAVQLSFGAEWTQYWVPFADVRGNTTIETDKLTNLQFLTETFEAPPFDFWIDDIAFYFGPPGCCPSGRGCEGTLAFAEPALEAEVRSAVQKPMGALLCEDSCTLHQLTLPSGGIRALDGLECLAGLMALHITQNQLGELGPLEPLTNLTTLSLTQNQIVDLSSLANLKNLTTLELGKNQIVDATPLSGLRALRLLDLSENLVTDVGALSGLSALSTLDLSNNRLLEVPRFPDSSLKILLLASNQLEDVGALSGLEQLTELSVRENQLQSIRLPFSLPKLTGLDASLNQLADISGISGAPLLGSLLLFQNQITDVSPLAALTSLSSLNLSMNPLADVSPLSGLKLSSLDLSQTQVSDLRGLAGMSSLRFLALSDTPVADLGPLSGATLSDLYLARTQVRELVPLSRVAFSNVTFERGGRSGVLDLSGSQVEDLGPLVNSLAIPAGFHVVVTSNPIDCQAQAGNIAALRSRGVVVDVDCP